MRTGKRKPTTREQRLIARIEPERRHLAVRWAQQRALSSAAWHHLNDGDAETRRLAIWLVAQSACHAHQVDSLIARLRARPDDRRTLTDALWQIAERHPDLAHWIAPTLAGLAIEAGDEGVRFAAVFGLRHVARDDVGDVLVRVANEAKDPELRGAAIESMCVGLMGEGATEADRSQIVQWLADPCDEVRFWACFATASLVVVEARAGLRALVGDPAVSVTLGISVGAEATGALQILDQERDGAAG